jgi:hypothetical protein
MRIDKPIDHSHEAFVVHPAMPFPRIPPPAALRRTTTPGRRCGSRRGGKSVPNANTRPDVRQKIVLSRVQRSQSNEGERQSSTAGDSCSDRSAGWAI